MRSILNRRVLAVSLGSCLLILSIVLVVRINAQSSGVIFACYRNNSGNLRWVSGANQCTSQETEISWNVTGPQGSQGIQGVQGPPGPQGQAGTGILRVFDSNNVEVGRYEQVRVIRFVQSVNRWLYFRADKNGFIPSGLSYIYTSSDCSGSALPNVNLGDDFRAFVQSSLLDGDNVYYSTGPAQSFTFNSQKSSSGQCNQQSGTTSITPFASFSLASLGNTPPFHLVE